MRQRRDHHLNQVAAAKLHRRQIDGDLDVRGPFRRLGAGLPQHPFAQRDDQPDILGNRNEVRRRDHALLRVAPAQQRFKAADPVGGEIDQRLVVHFEFAIGEGAAQIELHVAALLRLPVHLPFEEVMNAAAVGLGAVQRHVGVAHQFLAGVAVAGRERDADAGANDDLDAVDVITGRSMISISRAA